MRSYIESRPDNNNAPEKGMLIEQVQKILEHEQVDMAFRYAMVN